MAAVGKWGGRIGYVGNLKGCPYIHCNPPFVHSSNKACSLPRLLRHSGSGLGGVLGGGTGGRNAPPTASASAGASHCAIMDSCIFFPFQHWSMAGPLVASMPPVLSFLGCKATLVPLSFPSPLVTRGQIFKKAVKSTAYFSRAFFVISN